MASERGVQAQVLRPALGTGRGCCCPETLLSRPPLTWGSPNTLGSLLGAAVKPSLSSFLGAKLVFDLLS